MSSRHRSFASLAVVASMLLFANVAIAQEYKIKLNRADKVGAVYTVSVKGESKMSQNVMVEGADPQKQENAMTIQLDGTINVLEVTKTNNASKVSFRVSKCLKDGKSLVDQGAEIIAENKGGKTTYTVDGKEADPATADALSVVLSPRNPDDTVTDDLIFGTDEPKKVGDTWDMNTEAAAQSIAKEGLPIKKENLKGSATLNSVKQVDGKEVMDVSANAVADKFAGTLPDGAPLTDGNMKVQFQGIFPTDVNAQPVSVSLSMRANFKSKGQSPEGKAFTAEITVDRHVTTDYGQGKQ